MISVLEFRQVCAYLGQHGIHFAIDILESIQGTAHQGNILGYVGVPEFQQAHSIPSHATEVVNSQVPDIFRCSISRGKSIVKDRREQQVAAKLAALYHFIKTPVGCCH